MTTPLSAIVWATVRLVSARSRTLIPRASQELCHEVLRGRSLQAGTGVVSLRLKGVQSDTVNRTPGIFRQNEARQSSPECHGFMADRIKLVSPICLWINTSL
jgi:hypothetical protein